MPDETTSPSAQHPENHDTLLLRMLYDEQARLRNEIESLREKQQSGGGGKEGKEDKGGSEEKGGGEDKKKGADEGKGDDKKDDDKEKKKPKEPLAKRIRSTAVEHPVAAVLSIVGFILLVILGIVLWLYISSYENTDDAFIDGHTDPISARINGYVAAIYVEDTYHVKKGQLLVELDQRDNQISKEQAIANLSQAQAAIRAQEPNVPITAVDQSTRVTDADLSIVNAKANEAAADERYKSALADLRQAEAKAANSDREEERYRLLVEKEEVSREKYDQQATQARMDHDVVVSRQRTADAAQKAVVQGHAQVGIAEAQAAQARHDLPKQIKIQRETLAQRQANALSAKAQSDQAELNLQYTKIYAPEDGIVGDKQVQLASQVAPGQELFAITQTNDLWVTANFKETQVRKMHAGQAVDIYVDALSETFHGHIEALPGASGAIYSLLPPENATGNYVKVVQRLPVRIRIDAGQKDAGRLAPGMSVEPKVLAALMPGGWNPKHSPWLIAVAVMIATFMEVMDTSIASVAVPYIAGSTASTNDEATWVLTVYLVANAIFLPASNWFAMRFGRKRFLIFSIAVFTVASFLCGIAPSLPFILLARAIQGAGGGALQPLSQAILLESFPEEKQGQALGLYALGVVLAPVIGPAFGGYLTDAISWRWAFYINVPIGILAIILQSKFLEDSPEIKNAKPGKFDGVGLGLLGIWIACLQFVLDKGQEDDWFGNAGIRWAVAIFVVTFVFFLIREFRHDKPLVDLRALRNRNLGLGCLLVFALGAVLYALTTVLPVVYQTLLGYDATSAGLVVSPRGLGSVLASVGVGILVSKMNPKWIVAAGFATLGLSSLWLSFLTLDIAPITLFWPTTISGFGLAMIFVPLSKVALGTLPKGQTGNASAIFNFLRNIGGSIGISAANTIAQRHLQSHRNDLVHWYSGARPIFQRTIQRLTIAMHAHAGPRRSALRAFRLADSGLNHQAQLYAYVDDFRYLALLCLFCIPLAFFFKRPDPGAQGGG